MERPMSQLLLRQYRKKVEKLARQWNDIDSSQKRKRQEPGQWSFTEMLVHLELVQQECLNSMQERLDSGIKKPSGWKYTQRFIRLRLAMWSHRKFKAPEVVKPPADEALLRNWEPSSWLKSLDALEQFYRQLPSSYKNILLFKHPLAGPMKARHGLIFLIDHLEHHRRGMLR